MEILAPAGDREAFDAALNAGANAVYLGLQQLNARRGARNFTPEELPELVRAAHERSARVYLTLNIDVAQRELGQAVRILQLAADCGVDAVLVRDPGLIHLRGYFPGVEYHFSTQACIANSADVRFAGEAGASRVVLARELSVAEIAACSNSGRECRPAVQTEVFVQGALCFCVSGRCLLSSWAGGRSGNRGTCTSPCRVPWTANQQAIGTPLSMKDLSAIPRLQQLQEAGVAALKIEGRLKSAKWVEQAVKLFVHPEEAAMEGARELGAYTGRQLTWGYLDGQLDSLVAEARGRMAAGGECTSDKAANREEEGEEEEVLPQYAMTVDVTERGIVCTCTLSGRSTSWTMPRTVVKRENKAITIQKTLDWLKQVPVQKHILGEGTSNSPEFLLVPRAANGLPDHISTALRQLAKGDDETLRLDLPEGVRVAMTPPTRHGDNHLCLGDAPDRVRIEAWRMAEFVRKARASGRPKALPATIVLEQVTADQVERLVAAALGVPLVVALPTVFFVSELVAIQQLVAHCVAAKVTVEANTWGGLKLAREAGAMIEAGPGLGVLNTLAAEMLRSQQCRCVHASIEADRRQLEDLSGHCPAPLCVTVFGRPALMVTRVKLTREEVQGKTLRDRRSVELSARLEHGLWTLRPVAPFDLRPLRNAAVHAAHLVVDLVGSPDPAGEWLRKPLPGEKSLRFNYGRTLQ